MASADKEASKSAMTTKTDGFKPTDPGDLYHRLKRTSLLFCAAVIVTFIPAVNTTSFNIGIISVGTLADVTLRAILLICGTYYFIGFFLEFYHTHAQNNSLAEAQGEIDSALKKAEGRLRVAADNLDVVIKRWSALEPQEEIQKLSNLVDVSAIEARIVEAATSNADHQYVSAKNQFVEETSSQIEGQVMSRFAEQYSSHYHTSDEPSSRPPIPSMSDYTGIVPSILLDYLGRFNDESLSSRQTLAEEISGRIRSEVTDPHSESLRLVADKLEGLKVPDAQLQEAMVFLRTDLPRYVAQARTVAGRYRFSRWAQLYIWDLGAVGGLWLFAVAACVWVAIPLPAKVWAATLWRSCLAEN